MAAEHAMWCSGTRLLTALCGSAIALQLIGGCAKDDKADVGSYEIPRAYLRPAPFDQGDRPVSEAVILSSHTYEPVNRLVSRQQLTALPVLDTASGTVTGTGIGELRRVKLSVADAKIQEVVHALLGPDGLDKNYVVDPQIQRSNATITMDVDQEMTPRDIRDLLNGLAGFYGWTIQDVDGVVQIRPSASMAANAQTPILETMAAIGDQTPVMRVRRLEYLSVAEVSTLLGELLSEGGKAVSIGRTLILVDTAANVNRLSRLVTALDVPAFSGVEIWTHRLGWRDPESAAVLLEEIADATMIGKGTGTEQRVAFVPLPGTPRLMVISRDPTVQTYIADLIEQIDHPPEYAQRHRYLYRVQYYDPQALLNLVTSFFSDRIESASAGTGGPGAGRGQQGNNAGPVLGGAVGVPGIRLAMDPRENLLLIQSTPEDYADLVTTLRMIDRPRQQVALTSIIAEVRLNDTLEYGVEYFLRALDEDGLGILELAGGVSELLGGAPTGGAFFTGADGFAIIQALETVSDVNVLAQPKLTSMDGETARILIGGRTPVPEGDIDTVTGGLRRDINYEDVGIELSIEPKINESGDVTLKIIQTINDVVSQGELGPEFTTREIETNVTVPHGRTLLIGGIIEVDNTLNERKIPFLGDLPGVGAAFKSVEDIKRRNELLLAITPTIVNTPSEGSRVLSEFLQAARGVSKALHDNSDIMPRGILEGIGDEFQRAVPVVPAEDAGAGEQAPQTLEDRSAVEGADAVPVEEARQMSEDSQSFAGPVEGQLLEPVFAGPVGEPEWTPLLMVW